MKTKVYRFQCFIRVALIFLFYIFLMYSFKFLHYQDNILNCGYDNADENISFFPSSLLVIDSEAFSNTSIEIAVFRDEILHVGDEVFAYVDSLSDVYLPGSLIEIGLHTFSDRVVIHGVVGSYAQEWAQNHGIDFVPSNIWNTSNSVYVFSIDSVFIILCFLVPDSKNRFISEIKRASRTIRSMLPKDRIELYPINYKFP